LGTGAASDWPPALINVVGPDATIHIHQARLLLTILKP